MKQIKANIPLDNPYFWHVTPAPTKDKFELQTTREILQINNPDVSIIAERHSYLHFSYKHMSEIICKAAYGFTRKQMEEYLRARFPSIKPDTEIAFWLFKQLEVKTRENAMPGNIGLNQL